MKIFEVSAQGHYVLLFMAFVFAAAVILLVYGWRCRIRHWEQLETDKQPLDDRIATINEVIMLNLYGDREAVNDLDGPANGR